MRTPTSATNRAGFTLVELSVVVVIVGVLSALVFAHLDSFIPGRRLQSAASRIIAAARLARGTARMRRCEVFLEYDLDEGTWALSAIARGEEGPEATGEGELEVLTVSAMPEDVRISAVHYGRDRLAVSGTICASFRPSGAVGEHMVVLESSSAGSLAVYVPALSGAAYLVEDGSSYAQIRSEFRFE